MAAKPEKIEEGKFVKKVESHDWECYKLQMAGPYGKRGYNDRLVLAAYGVTALFEFKKVGEDPEKLQNYRHKNLRRLGHKTYVVYFAQEAYDILISLVKEAKAQAEEA